MVDKFINYTDDFDTLQKCFEFVFDYAEQFEAPTIAISAYREYDDIMEMDNEEAGRLRYGVSVSGNVSNE